MAADQPELKPLDLFATPLAGTNLIEASAGTGKTYTITGLFLRLILEGRHRVDKILVVTYTVAATEELRDRIRQRLVEVRDAFARNRSPDPFGVAMLDRFPDPAERALALKRLENAVRGFDESAIFTIHSFCQRVLADKAFHSGMAFETELMAEELELVQEAVDDYWRRMTYEASPLYVDYLLGQGFSPESLLQELRPHLGKPYLEVLGPEDVPAGDVEHEVSQAWLEAHRLWQSQGQEVRDLLIDNDSLNGNRYRKASLPNWLDWLDELLRLPSPDIAALLVEFKPNATNRFEKFTSGYLAESVKKNKTAPGHPFFDACQHLAETFQELAERFELRGKALKADLLAFLRAELARRKAQLRVQSYDDLLLNLHTALKGPGGKALAEGIRRRYSAALIDEFQDTDPIQYWNFRQIYGPSQAPVFLVGDPKQAIYSFRGADIFAYLEARRDADHLYTLDVNWRSQPGLIGAVNALFSASVQPFLYEGIPFIPVRPAAKPRQPLTVAGDDGAPFRFWLIPRRDDHKLVAKDEAGELAARATAGEIARLLNLAARGQATLGERPLEGGHIAVLVPTHRRGRQVRRELLRLNIPSVQQSQEDVFQSREAQELERVLMAVAEPGRESLVRAALVTELLGTGGETLHALTEDEAAWENRLDAFRDYHRLWREHGFIRAFRTLYAREELARRLLGYRDGERRLTNLLHLAELLQGYAVQARAGMEGVIKWLAQRRQVRQADNKDYELRLESDENLVKIVTIHKSKGLEYPVVFVPFPWDDRAARAGQGTFAFHDPDQDNRAFLDLGSGREEAHGSLARREALAEGLRLLYVALTRARDRCYLVWGNVSGAADAAAAWLLHPPQADDPRDPWEALRERVKGISDADLAADLARIAAPLDGQISIDPLPLEVGERYRPPPAPDLPLAARPLPAPPPPGFRVTSFSALATGHGGELPDYEAGIEPDEAPGEGRRFLDFPRGARAGRCLHAILEHLEFTRVERADLEGRLVPTALRSHGFDADVWTRTLVIAIERILQAPLDHTGNLRLEDISFNQRLNELEFYYPLPYLSDRQLRALLGRYGHQGPIREQIGSLQFSPVQGFMKGYIDLVFEAGGAYYLADYKSNWLGGSLEAYREEALPAVMARDSYYLQYLIYTVALHRYLRLRIADYDYDRHFGGVFYLFLRGMEARRPEYGVFRDRPDRALIEALDRMIALGEEVA